MNPVAFVGSMAAACVALRVLDGQKKKKREKSPSSPPASAKHECCCKRAWEECHSDAPLRTGKRFLRPMRLWIRSAAHASGFSFFIRCF